MMAYKKGYKCLGCGKITPHLPQICKKCGAILSEPNVFTIMLDNLFPSSDHSATENVQQITYKRYGFNGILIKEKQQ